MEFEAAIFDLDGVLTRTADLHARAWKEMFDAFLEGRPEKEGEDASPFDPDADYRRLVDGKPRLDGVRAFLEARGIALPEGEAEDDPPGETVRGLGRRKNDIFLQLLERDSIEVFEDAVEQLHAWRATGLRTAVITASRNGQRVLEATGLLENFEVTVDGHDAERLGIEGKPAPDIFLHAARALGVDPGHTIVIEDAVSGVEAGKAGGFGLVVGVARNGGDDLRAAGADLVVRDLREADAASREAQGGSRDGTPSALAHVDRIAGRLDGRRPALFFDYDGTLTPIVRRPEDARLSAEMRALLSDLSGRVTVAIVSGRDLADVRKMVGLEELTYAGSHGFDVAGPRGLRMQQEDARDHLPELDAAETELTRRLKKVGGVWLERKRFALAVHFREAEEAELARIEEAVDRTVAAHSGLRKRGGKKIFELQPDVPWDKGRAVRWLLDELGLGGGDVRPIYLGDDLTDEDAFAALPDGGVGIRVGAPDEPTRAGYHLRDTDELLHFGRALLERIGPAYRDDG